MVLLLLHQIIILQTCYSLCTNRGLSCTPLIPCAPPGDSPARPDDDLVLHYILLVDIVVIIFFIVEIIEVVGVDLIREAVVVLVVAILVAVGGAALKGVTVNSMLLSCTFRTLSTETNDSGREGNINYRVTIQLVH